MKHFLLAGAAALSLATAAQAAPINATGSVSMIGISSSTATIGINTTFTNVINSILGGATGDLVPVIGSFGTTDPVTATTGSAVSFAFAFGTFSGTVSAGGVSASGPVTNRVVDVFALGTFTPLGVLAGFDAGPMSATFSFTQTGGPGSAVSGSFSIASPPAPPPPPPGVPAPAALALFGMGLAGLGLLARRKA